MPLFWDSMELGQKLKPFKTHYNEFRVHQSLNGVRPEKKGGGPSVKVVDPEHYEWKSHGHGLFQLPITA
jgi:hypothetical protein